MSKVMEFLRGKKTYIVAGVAAVISALQIFGVVGTIPEYIWTLLGAAGLGAIRDSLAKVTK